MLYDFIEGKPVEGWHLPENEGIILLIRVEGSKPSLQVTRFSRYLIHLLRSLVIIVVF